MPQPTEYRGFRCVNAFAAIFVISSQIGDKNGSKKFEINRDLVSMFKKVTKKIK